jgi:hypothetical protein
MKKAMVLCIAGLLLSACKERQVSQEEKVYLERTQGFVEANIFPPLQEILGSDGYLLRFEAGPSWQSQAGSDIRVQGLNGKWMPFYAGDSGTRLTYCPDHFTLAPEAGELVRLYIIASPEDSIAEIVVDNHHVSASLYVQGDPVEPANLMPPGFKKGGSRGSFHTEDTTRKNEQGLFSQPGH